MRRFALLAVLPWVPPAKRIPAAAVNLDNCNGCSRCFDDCPFGAIAMVPRSDGRAYDTEPVVNPNQCTSCGICAGSCPTSTPFRRSGPLEPGIDVPNHPLALLRNAVVSRGSTEQVLVFACDSSGTGALQQDGVTVIELPCVGMLPPSFVDFALARGCATGVMIAGCAEGDCQHRLGNDWTAERMARRRDPFLRQRVDTRRLLLSWLPRGSTRRRQRALDDFRARLVEISDE